MLDAVWRRVVRIPWLPLIPAIAIALGVGSASAAPDVPLTVRAGLAVTYDLYRAPADSLDDSATRPGPGFHADVGYRIIDKLAAIVHLGITRNHDTGSEFRPPDVDIT